MSAHSQAHAIAISATDFSTRSARVWLQVQQSNARTLGARSAHHFFDEL